MAWVLRVELDNPKPGIVTLGCRAEDETQEECRQKMLSLLEEEGYVERNADGSVSRITGLSREEWEEIE